MRALLVLEQRDQHRLDHEQMKELELQVLNKRDQQRLAKEQFQDRAQEVEQAENREQVVELANEREQVVEGVRDLVISPITWRSRRTRVQAQEQEGSSEEEVGDSDVEWFQGASDWEESDDN